MNILYRFNNNQFLQSRRTFFDWSIFNQLIIERIKSYHFIRLNKIYQRKKDNRTNNLYLL
jgi:hypothetical protein